MRARALRWQRPGALAAALAATLLAGVAALGCGGSGEANPATVEARDFAFEPATTAIRAGETITWTNTGQQIHNVKGRGFFSDGLDPGDAYRHSFRRPGSYRYVCTLHPQMKGVVEVGGEN